MFSLPIIELVQLIDKKTKWLERLSVVAPRSLQNRHWEPNGYGLERMLLGKESLWKKNNHLGSKLTSVTHTWIVFMFPGGFPLSVTHSMLEARWGRMV